MPDPYKEAAIKAKKEREKAEKEKKQALKDSLHEAEAMVKSANENLKKEQKLLKKELKNEQNVSHQAFADPSSNEIRERIKAAQTTLNKAIQNRDDISNQLKEMKGTTINPSNITDVLYRDMEIQGSYQPDHAAGQPANKDQGGPGRRRIAGIHRGEQSKDPEHKPKNKM